MDELDFPDALLRQLDEHTQNGFLLFYANPDGDPSYLPYSKSLSVVSGLLSHAKACAVAMESIMIQEMLESLSDDS